MWMLSGAKVGRLASEENLQRNPQEHLAKQIVYAYLKVGGGGTEGNLLKQQVNTNQDVSHGLGATKRPGHCF